MPRFPAPAALLVACALALPAAAQTTGVGFGGGAFDRGAPVEVAADSLEVDGATGRAVLTGNVAVAQGDMRLSAAQVVVEYATEGGERRIERMRATGDVVLVAGEDAAEGQEAVYVPGTGEVVLTGDVVVTQGAATLAGDRLAVDLVSGSGTVTGRVRTVLQP